jgi:IstB-like ATP binding protein
MTTTTKTNTNGPMTMTTLAPSTHELERQLRTLSLSGMAQTLLARNQEAISHHLAYTEFLELLVSDELTRRRDRLFTRRLKGARVRQIKTLETFDWSFNPQIPKGLILDLCTGSEVPWVPIPLRSAGLDDSPCSELTDVGFVQDESPFSTGAVRAEPADRLATFGSCRRPTPPRQQLTPLRWVAGCDVDPLVTSNISMNGGATLPG